MRSNRAWAAVAVALSFAVPAAAEDLTIVYNLTENGQPKGTATHYVSSERMRMSQPDNDIIVEYASGRFVSIDHKKKEYWETTRDEMAAQLQQVTARLEATQKEMDAKMQNMPPGAAREDGRHHGRHGGPGDGHAREPAAGRSPATTPSPTRSRMGEHDEAGDVEHGGRRVPHAGDGRAQHA